MFRGKRNMGEVMTDEVQKKGVSAAWIIEMLKKHEKKGLIIPPLLRRVVFNEEGKEAGGEERLRGTELMNKVIGEIRRREMEGEEEEDGEYEWEYGGIEDYEMKGISEETRKKIVEIMLEIDKVFSGDILTIVNMYKVYFSMAHAREEAKNLEEGLKEGRWPEKVKYWESLVGPIEKEKVEEIKNTLIALASPYNTENQKRIGIVEPLSRVIDILNLYAPREDRPKQHNRGIDEPEPLLIPFVNALLVADPILRQKALHIIRALRTDTAESQQLWVEQHQHKNTAPFHRFMLLYMDNYNITKNYLLLQSLYNLLKVMMHSFAFLYFVPEEKREEEAQKLIELYNGRVKKITTELIKAQDLSKEPSKEELIKFKPIADILFNRTGCYYRKLKELGWEVYQQFPGVWRSLDEGGREICDTVLEGCKQGSFALSCMYEVYTRQMAQFMRGEYRRKPEMVYIVNIDADYFERLPKEWEQRLKAHEYKQIAYARIGTTIETIMRDLGIRVVKMKKVRKKEWWEKIGGGGGFIAI